jgi:hypothetical protein
MFLTSGEATETVDVMQYIWTGKWPQVRSPKLQKFSLAGKTAQQNIHLFSGQDYAAAVAAESFNGDSLTYSWEILEESDAKTVGGDFESEPARVSGLIEQGDTANVDIKAPAKPGAYRLFVYVHNGHQKAAYANIPFYVDVKTGPMASH